MGVNKFNCEGYYDPTAYEALTKIEQEAKALRAFRPVVYICSPLAGDLVKNQENARTYCRFAVEAGCVPIAPHKQWECAIDPETAKGIRDDRAPEHEDSCSMCGKFCAVRSMNKALSGEYIDIL